MVSLYGRLFKYRERPSRRPKEDFLTEAMSDLLSRMPNDKSNQLVAELLIPKCLASQQEWYLKTDGIGDFIWETQKTISYNGRSGRLDLTMGGPSGETLLIVENKVGSPVGQHEIPNDVSLAPPYDDRGTEADNSRTRAETVDQLEVYRRWLKESCSGLNWRGAICLLTHSTTAPADFCADTEDRRNGPWRHVCRWNEVWRWIEREARSQPGHHRDPWQVFAHDFAEYLKEEGMNSEQFTNYDISACNIFVKSGERFKHSFNVIWDIVQRNNPQGVHRQSIFREPFAFGSDGGVIWDWVYLRPPFSAVGWNNSSIGWGLRFPELSSWWNDCDPLLPSDTHAFVTWGAEGKPPLPKLLPNEVPNGWSISAEPGIVISMALRDFQAEPDGIATALGEWISAQVQKLLPYIGQRVNPSAPARRELPASGA